MELIPIDILQASLNALGYKVVVDGDYGPKTKAAVIRFQSDHTLNPDGVVGPKTSQAITDALAKWTQKVPPKIITMHGLTEEDYQEAADFANLTRPHIKAIVKVEANGSGWFNDVRADILNLDGQGGFLDGKDLPKILFEAKWFHKLTGGKWSATHPKISSPVWDQTLYVGGVGEYRRLYEAMKLDLSAALQSASWGMGQIMGANFKLAGYEDVFSFVDEMKKSDRAQLMALVSFVKNSHLDDELRRKDWAGFAKGYNGSGYAKNQYDIKLKTAYEKAGGL